MARRHLDGKSETRKFGYSCFDMNINTALSMNKVNLTRIAQRIIYFDIKEKKFFSIYDPVNSDDKQQNIIMISAVFGNSIIKLLSSLYKPINGITMNIILSIIMLISIYLVAANYLKKLYSNLNYINAYFHTEELTELIDKAKKRFVSQ